MSQFHLGWIKRKVRVRPASSRGVALPHAIQEQEAEDITQFVQAHGLGHRCSYDMWRLNSQQAVTMFKLRWA